MGRLVILDKQKGDLEIKFDREGSTAVLDRAKEEFDTRRAEGYTAFRMDPSNPGKGTVIHDFDENAEETMMVPPVAGG